MKNQLTVLMLALTTGVLFASCLSHDDNDVDYSLYNDAAVTAFSINTLKKTSHTTASTGEDSTYTESFTATSYKFYIDHERGLIYNPDSLPYTTDVSHVLATISTKNSGVLVWQSIEPEDNGEYLYTYYSDADSVDFTQPRILRVLALNGEGWRDYTVTVNVHQEAADSMSWQQTATVEGLTAMHHTRIFTLGNDPYIIASDGTQSQLWHGSADGKTWSKDNMLLGADAWQNVVVSNDKAFILDDGAVQQLSGTSWASWGHADTPLSSLVAASPAALYALSANGKLVVSEDEGATWKEEQTDDDSAPLPTGDFSYTLRPLKTNTEILRINLFGTTPERDHLITWTKLLDTTNAAFNDGWSFVDAAGDTRYVAPKRQGLTVLDYDGRDIAFGLNDDGTLATPLQSNDGGITWKTYDAVTFPSDITTGAPFAITVDDDSYLWIVDAAGQVWRGRINRLGW